MNLCVSPSLYVEISTPKVIVLRDGLQGEQLYHEGDAFMKGISVLKKGRTQRALSFSWFEIQLQLQRC